VSFLQGGAAEYCTQAFIAITASRDRGGGSGSTFLV
jgi:hypothetical protein